MYFHYISIFFYIAEGYNIETFNGHASEYRSGALSIPGQRTRQIGRSRPSNTIQRHPMVRDNSL
ncbi:hypothetical protein M422DRAFT_23600, partial [Sphaerobolus stellatus SS14]